MERSPTLADKALGHAAAQAAETDPVLRELDAVLGAEPLYQQACAKLDGLDAEVTSGEVLLRMLLVKHLYDWSEQQIVEQVEDSLVLRWFCRLGLQPAPAISSVWHAADTVPLAALDTLDNRAVQVVSPPT